MKRPPGVMRLRTSDWCACSAYLIIQPEMKSLILAHQDDICMRFVVQIEYLIMHWRPFAEGSILLDHHPLVFFFSVLWMECVIKNTFSLNTSLRSWWKIAVESGVWMNPTFFAGWRWVIGIVTGVAFMGLSLAVAPFIGN